jgi:peptidoglycan/xylan/chitin deacetylase (PgdA/CDA1 family)
VSLSFDDGPTPLTRQYVDAFTAKGSQAMFFFVGVSPNTGWGMQARPSDAQYAASKGMVLGDHTWDHKDLATLTNTAQQDEIRRQKDLAQSLTSQTETVIRAPYGSYTGQTYTNARAVGMELMTWTDDTKDWQDPAVSTTVNFVLNRAANQKIFLMHDGHANTLSAIPQILDGLKARNLCVGKIVPTDGSSQIPNEWGDPQFVRVVPF